MRSMIIALPFVAAYQVGPSGSLHSLSRSACRARSPVALDHVSLFDTVSWLTAEKAQLNIDTAGAQKALGDAAAILQKDALPLIQKTIEDATPVLAKTATELAPVLKQGGEVLAPVLSQGLTTAGQGLITVGGAALKT